MSRLVEYRVGDGETVIFEVEDDLVGTEILISNDPAKIAAKASDALERALDGIGPAAASIFEKVRGLSPEEVELAFGIKLTAEAGAIISKVGGEANIGVKLTWKSPSVQSS